MPPGSPLFRRSSWPTPPVDAPRRGHIRRTPDKSIPFTPAASRCFGTPLDSMQRPGATGSRRPEPTRTLLGLRQFCVHVLARSAPSGVEERYTVDIWRAPAIGVAVSPFQIGHSVCVRDERNKCDDHISWETTPRLRGELTASCLCYLFADLFMPQMDLWSRLRGVPGVIAPSGGSLVEIGLLETELVAVALWDLRAQGHLYISSEQPEYRRLFPRERRFGLRDPDPFSLRFTPGGNPAKTAGLEGELLTALDNSTSTLDALINSRWLSGKTLAINGVVVFAQREALSRGLLIVGPGERRLPRSLQWSKSLPRYVGDTSALEQFADAAIGLAEDVVRLKKSADLEWKTLMREASRALFSSRPYFHFDGGGGGG